MGTFLLFLLLFFVVIPLIRGLWQLWRIRSAYRRAQQRMNDIFNGASTGTRPTDGRTRKAQPSRKGKKIDPDVGEYVAFEEIRTQSTSTTADGAARTDTKTTDTVRVESQIEDADWEDL